LPDHLVAHVEVEAPGVRFGRVGVHRLPVLGIVRLWASAERGERDETVRRRAERDTEEIVGVKRDSGETIRTLSSSTDSLSVNIECFLAMEIHRNNFK
jgi:hypothetical protein